MKLIWFAVLVVLVVGMEPVGAFSLAGASRGLVIKKATVVDDRRNTIPMQLLSHPQRHQQRRSDDVETSLLPVGTDTRRSTASSSRGQLFSQSSGGDSEKNRNKQNIRVLGRLSVSGLLAYGYMQYWAVVTFGSGAYYLFQKTVRTCSSFLLYSRPRHFCFVGDLNLFVFLWFII